MYFHFEGVKKLNLDIQWNPSKPNYVYTEIPSVPNMASGLK